jgi:hypothetical protein
MTHKPKSRIQVRAAALQEWLTRHEARCLWQKGTGQLTRPDDTDLSDGAEPGRSGYVECHIIPKVGKIILINYYPNGQGWDIYVPASNDNRIDATLAAVEKAIGLNA